MLNLPPAHLPEPYRSEYEVVVGLLSRLESLLDEANIATVNITRIEELPSRMSALYQRWPAWDAVPVATRARVMERAGDLLAERFHAYCA